MIATVRIVVVLLTLSLTGCVVLYRSTARNLPSNEGRPGEVYCWTRPQAPSLGIDELVTCQDEEANDDLTACADRVSRTQGLATSQRIRNELKLCMKEKDWHLTLWGWIVV